jgi:hypothetical protein
MKSKKRVVWPDLRNGQLGSVWFGKEARNVPGTVPSVGLFWTEPMMKVIGPSAILWKVEQRHFVPADQPPRVRGLRP